jgi:hypothetical protein
MLPLPLLLTLSAAVTLAQKDFPPEIIPPNFTHRDVLLVDRIHYREDLRNDQIRVLHLNLEGDESVPLHDANDGLFICLKECHLRLDDLAGHLQDIYLENGQSRWIGAGSRTERNLTSQPVEMLFIESKPHRC